MSKSDTAVSVEEALIRFPSLASIRVAHRQLLERHLLSGDSSAFLEEVKTFIQQAKATGALLDNEDDRRGSQSLLDYWATVLYRAGEEPPDTTLADFDPEQAPALDDALCPYVGLDAFPEARRDVFFGRQRLLEELVNRLRDNRLLAVVGPSGSGKSSLVLAGLLPALRAGVIAGSQEWHYYPPIVPGSEPLAKLARLTQPSDVDSAAWIPCQIESFRQNPGHLAQCVRESSDVPVVLIVDQFEEIFTLCSDDQTRQAFVDNLLGLIQAPDARHTVILTMRSDFEFFVARLPSFQPHFNRAQVTITPLSAEEFREAIEKPAEQVGLKFEQGVIDELVQELLGQPAGLPLLQFTLLKMWENRQRNRVTCDTYRRLGGGRGALALSADDFYKRLIPEEQDTARRILLQLVRLTDRLEVTSNRIRRETLYQSGEARDRIDRVLDKLIRARLLRLTEGDMPADAQVEVAHEALLRNWRRLGVWIEEARETLRRRQRLTEAAEHWAAAGRNPGLTWTGPPLDEALRYTDLNDRESDFLEASKQQREEERQRQEEEHQREIARVQALAMAEERARTAQRMRHLAAALAVMFVMVAVVAVYAWTQKRKATENARLAAARELAMAAIKNADIDPPLSAQLAWEAAKQYPVNGNAVPEVVEALYRAVQAPLLATLSGHTQRVFGVAYSPDGRHLATGSFDGTARLWDVWDVASGQTVHALTGTASRVYGVAYSPDGKHLATANYARTATVWDTATGRELLTLTGHAGSVYGVAYSPEGTRLATVSKDRTVKVWDAATGRELLTLTDHTGDVYGVAFSPDGTRLATASADQTARIWDMATGQALLTLTDHADTVYGVAFNPDGTRLVTASFDHTAKVWDTKTGQETLTLSGHTDLVYGVVFSPDGRRLATASEDKTARVWDTETGQELFTLSGHTDTVHGVETAKH